MKRFVMLPLALLLALTACHTSQPEKVTRDLARLHAKAERGDARAQCELGHAYAEVWNAAEAIKWYRKAAEQGIPEAQYALGQYYAAGEGVPRDNAEAYAWFCLAAAQDSRQAMNARDKVLRKMSRAEIDAGNRRAFDYITKHPAAKGKAEPKVIEEVPAPKPPETNAIPVAPRTPQKFSSPKDQ